MTVNPQIEQKFKLMKIKDIHHMYTPMYTRTYTYIYYICICGTYVTWADQSVKCANICAICTVPFAIAHLVIVIEI